MAQKQYLPFMCIIFYNILHCLGQNCVQENPCLCRFNELQKIDLWPLVKSSTSDLYNTTSSTAKYFFSVCGNYTGPPLDCGFSKNNVTVQCTPPFSVSNH